ncbi:hypothetical protein [Aquimarina sediminis]|uniref:hypothetical protein n=1 Tax=Aquimarina sediminis TaxID=2070536 RepID=UPI000CA03457|nr:hypothetical protein [Aquimarina sediminis]
MKIEIELQNFPSFKLSSDQDLILFLIRNELLGTKFINQLSEIGFDTSFFSVELGTAILSLMGFNNRTDVLWQWYYEILDSYVLRVNLKDYTGVNVLAFDFYIALRIRLNDEKLKRE